MDGESQISIHAICRTCLTKLQNVATHDLFAVPGLAKKLCVCTSLSVEQEDGFPKNLCSVCYTKLNDLHAFQKQCVDSVQKLNDMVAKNCFKAPTYQINNVDVFNVQGQAEEEDRINFDPLLQTKLEIVDNEEEVCKMLENVDKEAIEVDEASASNNSDSEPEGFEADFDDDNDYQQISSNSSDSDDAMPLSRLQSSTRIASATKETDGKKKSFASCESENDKEKKPSKPLLKKKNRRPSKRRKDKHIECHICHKRYLKHSLYEEHMKHHNDQLPYQCEVETCKKGFTTVAGLKHHVDHTHMELVELHPCTVEGCDNAFPRVRMLNHHLKKVHDIIAPKVREHPCSECEKVFRCATALKKHMYKHTGEERPLSCNICSKRFRISSELKEHLLRHAGVKNHVCPYCGVGKTTKQEWNKHILTHTKEKQFQCTQCDHASHNKQALANHVKIVHMKIKDFACQYCGKTFGKSYSCKIHERIHTGENCCECKICGKVFLFEKRLTTHLKTHEKRENPPAASAEKSQGEGDGQETTESADVKPFADPAPKPKKSNRVELVDISLLAGTSVNPIPSVAVPSWSPQVNFTKKEGQHICPGCGRGFNHIGNMKLHYKIIHDKIKDYACRYCPRRFAKAQYLRYHEWIHTGEKPFECKICGKHFRQEQVLKGHIRRVHENPKAPTVPKKEKKPPANPRDKRLELNKTQPKILEEYQDPAAERAAATNALLEQQREEIEAKQRKVEKTRMVQEAACEQLNLLKQTNYSQAQT